MYKTLTSTAALFGKTGDIESCQFCDGGVLVLFMDPEDGSNSVYLLAEDPTPDNVELLVELSGGVVESVELVTGGVLKPNWRDLALEAITKSRENRDGHDLAFLDTVKSEIERL